VKLTEKDFNLKYSPDRAASYFVVRYPNTPGELRRTADGSLIASLKGKISRAERGFQVHFSPDPAATYFLVRYDDDDWTTELRRSADGSVVPFARGFAGVYFSPDPAATYYVARYNRPSGGELRRSSDNTLVSTLRKQAFDRVYFSPGKVPKYFVVRYINEGHELRRTDDGSLVATLVGELPRKPFRIWDFSPDTESTYFLVQFKNTRSELWEGLGGPHPLAKLGLGKANHAFDPESRRLIVRYTDGRAYLFDLDWLRAIGGDVAAISMEDLIALLCQGPFAAGRFDEVALKPYLEGSSPRVCRE
jgi:hypothetical protein